MNAPTSLPTTEQMLVSGAVRHVQQARNHLLAATITLDDAGLPDDDVSRAYSFVARLSSAWAGRRPPRQQSVPDYIADAAVAWRRQNGRSY